MKHQVIAICGMKRSGKDTIANYIASLGYKPVKISAKLKEICHILFGFSHVQMEDAVKDVIDERFGITPRKAMQFLGTEVMQYKIQELLPNTGRSFWINTLLQQEQDKIVISDMRFVHEERALRAMWGDRAMIIKVVRPELEDEDEHVSEKEWVDIKEDVLLVNNTTIDSLLDKVSEALGKANSP